MNPQVTVLFATQTGTAEDLAGQTADHLTRAGIPARAVNLDRYAVDELKEESRVLVIAATWGDGEPPDDCIDFFEAFTAAEGLDLSHLSYAGLALGDSNYDAFCGHGKDLDAVFAKYGAQPLRERLDCDMDHDEKLPEWLDDITTRLAARAQAETV